MAQHVFSLENIPDTPKAWLPYLFLKATFKSTEQISTKLKHQPPPQNLVLSKLLVAVERGRTPPRYCSHLCRGDGEKPHLLGQVAACQRSSPVIS